MSDSDQPAGKSIAPGLTSYTCPGELYSIPRGIHLARLAAYYPKCRDCEHRFDAGHVISRVEEPQRPTKTTLVTEESVRGVYLNELDRNRAIAWGEALAAYLWDRQPMIGRRKPDDAQIVSDRASLQSIAVTDGPTVVVGFDERPSSPDIVSGAVLGLRRMGCPVIDLGQTALPNLAFHAHSLDAAAGLFVTGAGCDSSLTGFEFLSRNGFPFPHEGLLKLEQSIKSGVGRQSRQIGMHRPFQGQAAYESSLETHFHALRPLRIVCGSSTRQLPRLLDRLFSKLPCRLTHVAIPMRRRNLFDVRDGDLHRVATSVVESQHHLGVIVDDDGRHAAFVTDRGRLVMPREVARLLIEIIQREHHQAKIVVSTSWLKEAGSWLEGRGATVIDGGETVVELVQKLVENDAVLALSADGRVWFRQSYPACDALLMLAHVLKALSLGDVPFSEIVARFSHD